MLKLWQVRRSSLAVALVFNSCQVGCSVELEPSLAACLGSVLKYQFGGGSLVAGGKNPCQGIETWQVGRLQFFAALPCRLAALLEIVECCAGPATKFQAFLAVWELWQTELPSLFCKQACVGTSV